MLRQGPIVSSRSNVVSMVLLVPKADVSLRPFFNFKRLKAATERDHYTMPLMFNVINTIAGVKIFSKFNLKYALKQIPVQPKNQKYTVIKCHKGVFDYNVMPFGLRNEPEVFQFMIYHVLVDLVGVCCVA